MLVSAYSRKILKVSICLHFDPGRIQIFRNPWWQRDAGFLPLGTLIKPHLQGPNGKRHPKVERVASSRYHVRGGFSGSSEWCAPLVQRRRHNYVFLANLAWSSSSMRCSWLVCLAVSLPSHVGERVVSLCLNPPFRKRPFFLTGLGEVWTSRLGRRLHRPHRPCPRSLRRWWLSTLPTCPRNQHTT